MTLETRGRHCVMTACPFCGAPLPDGIGFQEHWEGGKGYRQTNYGPCPANPAVG